MAFEKGNLPVARWFIQNGCDLGKLYKDKKVGFASQGVAPLIASVENGHLELVNLLLAMGANPNGVTCPDAMTCKHPRGPGNSFICKNWQALPLALYKGNNDIAKVLIAAGSKRNYPSETKSAVEGCNLEAIETFGMRIDSWSLVRSAVLQNNLHLVRIVLKKRSDHLKEYMPSENYDGFNYAALVNDSIERENPEITCDLLDAQPNFNINYVSWSIDGPYTRPIILAIQKNKPELVREFIRRGAWLNPILSEDPGKAPDPIDLNPLYIAAGKDNIVMVELLIQHGAHPHHLARSSSSLFSERMPVLDSIKRIASWSNKPNLPRIIEICEKAAPQKP